jgi:signal transduction histidine kinase/AmiR/NasT family two-component response regulator
VGEAATSIVGLLFSISVLVLALVLWARGHPGVRFFSLAWSALLVGTFIGAGRHLDLLPTTALTTYSFQIGSALEMLLLSFALADRLHVLRREKEAATAALIEAKDATVHALLTSEQRLEGRVAERTRELDEARAASEQASRHKSAFLATMSHEVRTPMNGILGMAHLLLETPLTAEQRDYSTAINQSGEALLGILNDILDLSKLEAGRMELECTALELRGLLGEVVQLMGPGARIKGLDLRWQVADEVPLYLLGDELRLRQVLLNLLSNAIKFTEKGFVAVSASTADECLILKVCDTGIGISPEFADQLFEPFRQADNTISRRFGGTGLGLAISHDLIALMQGTVRAESNLPEAGTTFIVSLPLRAAAASGVKTRELTARRPAPLNILLAEDNPLNQKFVTIVLERDGHTVSTARNGAEALAAAECCVFDVALMDMQMPVVDGIEATRRIRALPGDHGALPIIAMTANSSKSDEEACLAAGMTAFLPKPFRTEDLNAMLLQHVPAAARTGALDTPPQPAEADLDETYLAEQVGIVGLTEMVMLGRMFQRISYATLRDIRTAAERGDRVAAEELAHRLRSACGPLGLVRCSKLAKHLEVEARNLDDMALQAGIAQFRDVRMEGLRALRRLAHAWSGN